MIIRERDRSMLYYIDYNCIMFRSRLNCSTTDKFINNTSKTSEIFILFIIENRWGEK